MTTNVSKAHPAVLQQLLDEWYYGKKAPKPKPGQRLRRQFAWPTGRTIINVRWMTDAELRREGWKNQGGGVALDLNDGGILYASCDEEGNSPGVLIAMSPKGEAVRVAPLPSRRVVAKKKK